LCQHSEKAMIEHNDPSTFARYPVLWDNYLLSFTPDEPEEYLGFLKKYGFVVIKVLSEEECEESIGELFADANLQAEEEGRKQKKKVRRDEEESWESDNWPTQSKFLFARPGFGQKAFDNRTNENIYKVFCNIFGRTDLLTSIDFWGVMRGTKDLFISQYDGTIQKCDRPDWRYQLKPHIDWNPWVYVDNILQGKPEAYQGIIALDDCPTCVGGFCVVPGSRNYLPTWTQKNQPKVT